VFAGCVSAPLKLNTSECKYVKKGIKGVQIAFETRIVSAHFRSLLVADVPARSALPASSSGDLVVPRTRRRIGDTAFSVSEPRAWNTLPTALKLLRSTTTFRRQLINGHWETD